MDRVVDSKQAPGTSDWGVDGTSDLSKVGGLKKDPHHPPSKGHLRSLERGVPSTLTSIQSRSERFSVTRPGRHDVSFCDNWTIGHRQSDGGRSDHGEAVVSRYEAGGSVAGPDAIGSLVTLQGQFEWTILVALRYS